MPINFAEKYTSAVDERFIKASMSEPFVNRDFDWAGVRTVHVYSLPTVVMNDYVMNGNSRYGTPTELEDELQEMTLTQDRSFTFTIDRRNYNDTMMVKESGRALRRQLDEVVIPEVDIYRIAKIVAGAGNTSAPAPITNANAYDALLDGVNALTEGKAPKAGAVALITPKFYKAIRLDDSFIKSGDLSQQMLLNGQVGTIDGIPLVLAPTNYFPADVGFLVTNRIATTAAVKLTEYKVHDNPPGINGWLIEGRVYHDAFVLNNKKPAIYVHMEA